nr:MAG: hypothetical protein [Caudoviricetes sp.]
MNKKPLEVKIPNWAMFGARNVVINIFENVINGEILYSGALLFWLHDGVSEEDENYEEKTITLHTDVVLDDPKKCALIVAEYASNLFEELSSMVYVFNEEADIIMEFDLNDEEFEFGEVDIENYQFKEETKVLH